MKERELCTKCGGNGVLKIPGGVSQCDRCHGEGWDPGEPSIPVSQLRALSEQWKQRTERHAERAEHFTETDDDINQNRQDASAYATSLCAADLDRLLLGETETQG